MITVGLVKELLFIARAVDTKVCMALAPFDMGVNVFPDGYLEVFNYKKPHGVQIWGEYIDGDLSFFGIESCDSIAKIFIKLINDDPSWKDMVHIEQKKTLTK